MEASYFKGRGAQLNTANPFFKTEIVQEHPEGLDEPWRKESPQTELYYETPKNIISKNKSPDLPFELSINPYQGCEHGCIYCYARNAHTYWGFSAGLDFESKIIVKKEAPLLLEKKLLQPHWKPTPIVLSGNTDCYQPIEKELKITRELLKVFVKYRNPISIITKNSLVCRDIDILKDLAKDKLVHVYISITTLEEDLRRMMEPRTSHAFKKFKTIEKLSKAGIPVGVMVAPIIPSLNDHEIPRILQLAAEYGARTAGYTIVRLNGDIGTLFKDWLEKNFPERAEKVWSQIEELHGGQVSDSRWGKRMSGVGPYAQQIAQLFKIYKKKWMKGKSMPAYALDKFRKNANLGLFE